MMFAAILAGAMLDEAAKPARSFVDSIGVNTHFDYGDTPYGTRFDAVLQKLVDLGIRHVRDNVAVGRNGVCARERSLAKHGLHFTYIVPQTIDAAAIGSWAACAGPAIEAIEGSNEYDLSHPKTDPAWPATLRTRTQTLRDIVRANSTLRALPILAPSLTTRGAFAAVADLTPYVDAGNVHDYFGGHEPGTGGYGAGGYGSIGYWLESARAVSGAKPVYATENGYGTSSASGDVSEDVAAAYLPRLFFDQFAAGIVRTYAYELVDEGPDPFAHYGLLNADATPKPGYTALQSLVALFDDRSATGKTDRLRFRLDGGEGSEVRHALFQKNDGRFLLALWVERPSVEPHTHVPYPLPAIDVRVTTEDALDSLRAYVYGDDGKLERSGDAVSRGSIAVSLRDRAAIVEVRSQPEAGGR